MWCSTMSASGLSNANSGITISLSLQEKIQDLKTTYQNKISYPEVSLSLKDDGTFFLSSKSIISFYLELFKDCGFNDYTTISCVFNVLERASLSNQNIEIGKEKTFFVLSCLSILNKTRKIWTKQPRFNLWISVSLDDVHKFESYYKDELLADFSHWISSLLLDYKSEIKDLISKSIIHH